MSVKVVNSGPDTIKVSVETTPAVKVSSPTVSALSIGFEKGDKGDTGATGPAGPGVPAGGTQFKVLRKASGTDYDTEWDYADRLTIEVRFDEAVSKGDPLYITGFNVGQNRVTVAKADASDSSKMPSIGLAFADYSLNDNGQATTIGSLDDVNTQVSPHDFQEGDVLYVKAGGGLTNVKPTGTNLIQNVGKVGRRQQINGEIVVMAIGRSNDVPNIPNGQAWIGNSSGVATPTTLATVATSGAATDLTGTLPVANGGTGATTFTDNALILGNGSGALETLSELTYDSSTGTLRLTDSDVIQPTLDLKSTFASTLGATLSFTKDRSDNTQNDGDVIGLIQFNGEDDGGAFQTYASIHGAAEESGAGTEGGKLEIKVASHDGENVSGLIIEDGDAEDEVDVTIANGANSLTTVNGKLAVTTDATGIPFTVSLKADDIYIGFVSSQNNWYGSGYAGSSAGTSIGSETIAISNRLVSFVAPKACKVNSVYAVGYFSSTATWEFGFYKVPFVDDSNSSITWQEITSTDNDGSKTGNKTYKFNWDLSGANASLSAGDGLAFVFRRTDASGTSIFYGNAYADLQYT